MVNTYPITLKETRDVADGTRIFVFDKPEDFTFQAGQYVALMAPKMEGVDPDTKGLVRSLSIASAPKDDELCFVMRSGDSSFKKTCWRMKPGDTAAITKAVGFFTAPEGRGRPIVFLAGGIGITPVRAILKQAEHDGSEQEFVLFYSNRFEKDAAFLGEMRDLKLRHFRCVTVFSKSEDSAAPENDERGHIGEAMLRKYLGSVSDCLYYIVGSPQFAKAMEAVLDRLGIPKEQRHMDPFSGITAQSSK